MDALKVKPPKRHHYVPEFLQRRFVDEEGYLFALDRETGRTFRTRPRNLFVERDLYTRFDAAGEKDVEVETILSRIEGRANALIEKFVNATRRGDAPIISADEKSFWDFFFFLQIKRVPEFHSQYNVDFGFEEELSRIITEYEKNVRTLTEEERADLQSPETRARLKRNSKIYAVTRPGELVQGLLAKKGLAVAHIVAPMKSFVLGSSPVVKLNYPDRPHISDPSVEIWFPIAWDVAVSPSPEQGKVQRIEVSDHAHIRGINCAIAKQSKVIAGRSESLLRSVALPK